MRSPRSNQNKLLKEIGLYSDRLVLVGNWLIVYSIAGQTTVSGSLVELSLSYSINTVRPSVDAGEIIILA